MLLWLFLCLCYGQYPENPFLIMENEPAYGHFDSVYMTPFVGAPYDWVDELAFGRPLPEDVHWNEPVAGTPLLDNFPLASIMDQQDCNSCFVVAPLTAVAIWRGMLINYERERPLNSMLVDEDRFRMGAALDCYQSALDTTAGVPARVEIEMTVAPRNIRNFGEAIESTFIMGISVHAFVLRLVQNVAVANGFLESEIGRVQTRPLAIQKIGPKRFSLQLHPQWVGFEEGYAYALGGQYMYSGERVHSPAYLVTPQLHRIAPPGAMLELVVTPDGHLSHESVQMKRQFDGGEVTYGPDGWPDVEYDESVETIVWSILVPYAVVDTAISEVEDVCKGGKGDTTLTQIWMLQARREGVVLPGGLENSDACNYVQSCTLPRDPQGDRCPAALDKFGTMLYSLNSLASEAIDVNDFGHGYAPIFWNMETEPTKSWLTLRRALSHGPVVMVLDITDRFVSLSSRNATDPDAPFFDRSSGRSLGAHEITVVGYHETPGNRYKSYLIVQNSWGCGWGRCGIAYIRPDCCGLRLPYMPLVRLSTQKLNPLLPPVDNLRFRVSPSRVDWIHQDCRNDKFNQYAFSVQTCRTSGNIVDYGLQWRDTTVFVPFSVKRAYQVWYDQGLPNAEFRKVKVTLRSWDFRLAFRYFNLQASAFAPSADGLGAVELAYRRSVLSRPSGATIPSGDVGLTAYLISDYGPYVGSVLGEPIGTEVVRVADWKEVSSVGVDLLTVPEAFVSKVYEAELTFVVPVVSFGIVAQRSSLVLQLDEGTTNNAVLQPSMCHARDDVTGHIEFGLCTTSSVCTDEYQGVLSTPGADLLIPWVMDSCNADAYATLEPVACCTKMLHHPPETPGFAITSIEFSDLAVDSLSGVYRETADEEGETSSIVAIAVGASVAFCCCVAIAAFAALRFAVAVRTRKRATAPLTMPVQPKRDTSALQYGSNRRGSQRKMRRSSVTLTPVTVPTTTA